MRSPEIVSSLVAVDNAPVDATLSKNFAEYIRAMKKIDGAKVHRQIEADRILKECEEVMAILHISPIVLD